MDAHLGLFLGALFAATLVPLSSEAGLVGLLALGNHDPWGLFAAALAGNTLGSAINWVLGRYALHFRERRWFPVAPARLDQASAWFGRWGLWSLLLAWLPIVGDPLTVAAGLLRVPFGRVLALVALGKAARYLAVMEGWRWFSA